MITFGNSMVASRKVAPTLSLAFLLILTGWTTELPSSTYSTSDELLRHVRYLASDELMGRGVDTPGIDMARDYIAREFKKYGLVQGGENGTFLQRLDVVTGASIKEASSVVLGKGSPLVLDEEWLPLGSSRSGIAEGEIVFVG